MRLSLSDLFRNMNVRGVPIPLLRDPQTGKGSLTFSMSLISFVVCLALLGGKVTKLVGGADYDNALWLLGLALSAYLGRQYQKNGKQGTIGGVSLKTQEGDEDVGQPKSEK